MMHKEVANSTAWGPRMPACTVPIQHIQKAFGCMMCHNFQDSLHMYKSPGKYGPDALIYITSV